MQAGGVLREQEGRWRARVRRFWPIFVRWFIWAVLLGGLFPVGLLALIEGAQDGGMPTGAQLVGNGDLFLITSTLLLGSLQGLFVMKGRRGVDEAVLVSAVMMGVLGIVAWTLVTATAAAHKPFRLTWLPTWGGLGFLVIGLVVVGMSMWAQARSEGGST